MPWQCRTRRYERKPPCAFRSIVDTQFIAAMGPPGGGRNPVSARLLRHFCTLSFVEMSDESVDRIFTTILGSFFRKYFNESVQGVTQQVGEGRCHAAAPCMTLTCCCPVDSDTAHRCEQSMLRCGCMFV